MSGPTPLYCVVCGKNQQLAGSDRCEPCLTYEKLLAENILECPAFLTSRDFEKFMSRFAVHAHAQRTPEARHITLKTMELRLKEEVLEALPLYYVSKLDFDPASTDARETGAKGRYTLKTLLPQNVLFKALEKKNLIRPQDPEEGGAGV